MSTRNDTAIIERQSTQPVTSPNFGAIGKAIVPNQTSIEQAKTDLRRQSSLSNNLGH